VGDANDHDSATERVLGLGGAVFDDDALDQLLQKVVLLALRAVGPADAVSITVADNGGFRTSNSTAEAALVLDQVQYDGDDGPCLEALRSGRQVASDWTENGHRDPNADGRRGRWPHVRAKAEEIGVSAVLSTPLLQSPEQAIGALNIYSRDGDGFGEEARRTAELVGEHAAIVLSNALALIGATHLNEQLRAALASREIIGEAKGIIMERQSCTRDEAFDILRRASQRENRKLRDLAEELVLRVEARRGGQPGS
jgi:GAF domain-containing protein